MESVHATKLLAYCPAYRESWMRCRAHAIQQHRTISSDRSDNQKKILDLIMPHIIYIGGLRHKEGAPFYLCQMLYKGDRSALTSVDHHLILFSVETFADGFTANNEDI